MANIGTLAFTNPCQGMPHEPKSELKPFADYS